MKMDKPLMIKELPECERPREKVFSRGVAMLSPAELLAILLGTGNRKMSAVHLAEHLLKEYPLQDLAEITPQQLSKIKGIGPAKAVGILAAIELGKRIYSRSGAARVVIHSPKDVADLMLPELRGKRKESFVALFLSTKNHVLNQVVISEGTLDASLVHPRELFLEAIRFSAASVILVHNHPSGDPMPSKEDIAMTKRLEEAGALLGIPVLDHVVIGDGEYVSLKEKQYI